AIPKKSKMKGNQAIWLRLHNNSPLPIEIPTQSMYLPNLKCLYPLSNGRKLFALCDGSEIAVWHGLEDADGNSVPYGYDFGSSALLLPNTSALFPVPRQLLTDGFVIRFTFTFKKESESQELEDYGSANKVRVKNSDVPSLR
ncbi:MAG TPA: hypothetical protein VEF04_05895, partial [Blastocatellia bacterium]|nr:hypothetical protein [Blastocatellia bacterium]